MPLRPVPAPLRSRPRNTTTSVAAAFTTMPFTPPVARMPAVRPSATMEMDFVMVTAPKAPGSIALISPPAAVLLMAPANVRHGAVREHGFTSSPTPETQVRVACASASEAPPASARTSKGIRRTSLDKRTLQ
jgi:hypothetical protein